MLRPATADDVAAIEAIVEAAYSPYIERIGRRPGPMLEDYHQRVNAGGVHVLDNGGRVQGFIILVDTDTGLLLDNLAVAPHAQGLGLGRVLMDFAERQALDAGYTAIRLYTNEAMSENLALYTRRGYQETHRAEEHGLRRVYMSKHLQENVMENTWLAQAKRLQALASTGLHFCTDDFERERLEEIAEIAHSMLAQLGNVPLERITGLVTDFAQRYSTPMIDVRGAVIEGERILLVRELTDGCWALPGGYADIGLSAAENIIKEIREEAGLSVTARALYSVTHKAKGAYRPDVRDFYKLYFLCDRVDQLAPVAGFETTDVGFFALDELPPLSRGRTIESDLEAAFAFHRGETTQTLFD